MLDKPPTYVLLKYLTRFLYHFVTTPYVWPNFSFYFGQLSFNKIILPSNHLLDCPWSISFGIECY